MKTILSLGFILISLTFVSCKSTMTQKQKDADLTAINHSLKNSLPGSDITYDAGKVKIILGELVYFKVGSAEINESSSANLNLFADILKKYPRTSVDLNGYTDNTGTKAINDQLSLDRANNVKTYLEKKGVRARRMLTNGFADSNPVGTNTTAEGRQQNRRVEFLIYY